MFNHSVSAARRAHFCRSRDVEKIVLNLLSNALKYTFDGQISVLLETAGNCVELSVRDTGIGIGKSDLAHIFDRFHRVEGACGRSQEGSGIGLALIQAVPDYTVEAHVWRVRLGEELLSRFLYREAVIICHQKASAGQESSHPRS